MYRIMAVDDEPLVLEQLHMLIDHNDWNVQVVQDCHYGKEAMEKYISCLPDIIITDINMPDMDGLELIHRLGELITDPVAFIILSGYDDFEYAKGAIQLRVSDYILKPIFEEELYAAVNKAVKYLEEIQYSRLIENNTESIEKEMKPLVVEYFYDIKLNDNAVTSHDYIQLPDVLNNILLHQPEQACEGVKAFCIICSQQLIAPRMVLTSIVNLLSEACKNEELAESFVLKEWIERLELCNTLNQLSNVLEEWIISCCMQLQQKRIQNSKNLLSEMKRYLDEHFMENITITQLAEILYANPVYLGQAFAKKYGISIHSYITSLRIERAKILLADSRIPIHEIAFKVGYENYNVFRDHFVHFTQKYPKQYREHISTIGSGSNAMIQ